MPDEENKPKKKWVMNEAQKAAQFKKGQTGNAGGVPQQIRAQITLNAQKATALRQRVLDAFESRIAAAIIHAEVKEGEQVGESGISEEAAMRIMSYLNSDVLRLLTDAENRGYGNPTQPTRLEETVRRDISSDMSAQEAADTYRQEVEGK
jgi:hypothetical protein